MRGDLGRSIQQNRPVAAELADAWPATLQLTVAALLLAALVGIAAGVASAVWPNSLFDALARLGSLFGLSMPIFWTGLVLIVVFSLWLNWLPVGGAGSLTHLVLPAVTLALPSVAMIARMTRSAVLDVLREDYVRTARAKGVGEVVGARPPRPAQRLHPDHHAARSAVRSAHGRRRADRDGVRLAGTGPAHGQGDLRARLRAAAGRGAACSRWPS